MIVVVFCLAVEIVVYLLRVCLDMPCLVGVELLAFQRRALL